MMDRERYQRQLQLSGFGEEGQQKLAQAKVLVVGAGGLGVPVLQYLTGMGVGTIGIVDGDIVSLSNLHRQVIYSPEDVGQLKVACCVSLLSRQNPGIKFQKFPTFVTRENIISMVEDYDVVVDATDNFDARYLINDACVLLKKPFVYGAIQNFEGHVSVFNYQDGATYRCLYPSPPSGDQIPDCNVAGVLGIVPGLVGCHQALETIKIITGIGTPLSGILRVFDFLDNTQYSIKLAAKAENKAITRLQEDVPPRFCMEDQKITPQELLEWLEENSAFNLLDVRERHEFEQGHLAKAISLPLSQLNGKLPDLSKELPWVLICQQGGRSIKAIQHLRELDPEMSLFNLEGGMTEWIRKMGNKHLIT
jgi:molybdopterin/thiamine biosynthesis adenylyltransferase/rhodanese-related sulfurtransferase